MTPERKTVDEDFDQHPVTRGEFKAAIKLVRSDVKLYVIGALVASQVLANFQLPETATNAAAAVGGVYVVAKVALAAMIGR